MGCGASSEAAVAAPSIDQDLVDLFELFPRTSVPRDSSETSSLFKALRYAAALLRQDLPAYTAGMNVRRQNGKQPIQEGSNAHVSSQMSTPARPSLSSNVSPQRQSTTGRNSVSRNPTANRRTSLAPHATDLSSFRQEGPSTGPNPLSKHSSSVRNVHALTGSTNTTPRKSVSSNAMAKVGTGATKGDSKAGSNKQQQTTDCLNLTQHMLLLARIIRHPLCFVHYLAFIHTNYPSGWLRSESNPEELEYDDFNITSEALEALVALFIHCETVLKFGGYVPTFWNPFVNSPLEALPSPTQLTPSVLEQLTPSPNSLRPRPTPLRTLNVPAPLMEIPSPTNQQQQQHSNTVSSKQSVFTFSETDLKAKSGGSGSASARESRFKKTTEAEKDADSDDEFPTYSDSSDDEDDTKRKLNNTLAVTTPVKLYDIGSQGARRPSVVGGGSIFTPFTDVSSFSTNKSIETDHSEDPNSSSRPIVGTLLGPHLRSFQRDFITAVYGHVAQLNQLLNPPYSNIDVKLDVSPNVPSPRAGVPPVSRISEGELKMPSSSASIESPSQIQRLKQGLLTREALDSLVRLLKTKADFSSVTDEDATLAKLANQAVEAEARQRLENLSSSILSRAMQKYLSQLSKPLYDAMLYLAVRKSLSNVDPKKQINLPTQNIPQKVRQISLDTFEWMNRLGVYGTTGVSVSPSESTFMGSKELASLVFVREAILTLLALSTFSDFVTSPGFHLMMYAMNSLLKGSIELVMPTTAVAATPIISSSSSSSSSNPSSAPSSILSSNTSPLKSSAGSSSNQLFPQTLSSQLLFNDAVRCAPYSLFVGDWANVSECTPPSNLKGVSPIREAAGAHAGTVLPSSLIDGNLDIGKNAASSGESQRGDRVVASLATITKTTVDEKGRTRTEVITTSATSGGGVSSAELNSASGVKGEIMLTETTDLAPAVPRPLSFDLSRFALNRDSIRAFVSSLNWVPDSMGVFVISALAPSPNHVAFEAQRSAQHKYEQLQRAVRGLFSEEYPDGPLLTMHSRRLVLCNARFAQFAIASSFPATRPLYMQTSQNNALQNASTARPLAPTGSRTSFSVGNAMAGAMTSSATGQISGGETRDGHLPSLPLPAFLAGPGAGPGAGAAAASSPFALLPSCYRELLGREAASITIRERDTLIQHSKPKIEKSAPVLSAKKPKGPASASGDDTELPSTKPPRTISESIDRLERAYGVVTLAPAALPAGVSTNQILGSTPPEETPMSGTSSGKFSDGVSSAKDGSGVPQAAKSERRNSSGQISSQGVNAESSMKKQGQSKSSAIPVLLDRVVVALKPVFMRCKVGRRVSLASSNNPSTGAGDKSSSLGDRVVGTLGATDYVPYVYTPLFYVGVTFPIPLAALSSVNGDIETGLSDQTIDQHCNLFSSSSNYGDAIQVANQAPPTFARQPSAGNDTSAPKVPSYSRQPSAISSLSTQSQLATAPLQALVPVAIPTSSFDETTSTSPGVCSTSSSYTARDSFMSSRSSCVPREGFSSFKVSDYLPSPSREASARAYAEKYQVRNESWLNIFPDVIDVATESL